ncbi:arginyl-tRNA synthetase [Colletotrichum sojae]|uniref:Arginyl-tRNA synthetase n=1 Tax=Colletotrichum sojae TaxID=2175907 RepID=A0A8H6IU83_9PEZI|nr:arginyl-tRNA synthetase [Colletotrichum sojae]
MTGRRDRGTAVITPEERLRRAAEAKTNIRQEARFTPALLGRVESRIDANAFRRCISDNTIYQSLCNSLKDKNLEERDRQPDLVDFLALEAIVPVQYGGDYNRVLRDLFVRCHTETWVEQAVLEANHDWFQDQMAACRNFIRGMINKIDSQLLEIILEDIETAFWREKLTDHVVYKKVYAKIAENRNLTQRDVLSVVALHGGRYPTEIFRHLVLNQNSEMLNYGSNLHAQHALYDELEYALRPARQSSPAAAPPINAVGPVVPINLTAPSTTPPAPVASSMTLNISNTTELEDYVNTMENKQKSHQARKLLHDLKVLLKDDPGVLALHRVREGRIQKPNASGAGAAIDKGKKINETAKRAAGKTDQVRQSVEDENGEASSGSFGNTAIKREDQSSDDEGLFVSSGRRNARS